MYRYKNKEVASCPSVVWILVADKLLTHPPPRSQNFGFCLAKTSRRRHQFLNVSLVHDHSRHLASCRTAYSAIPLNLIISRHGAQGFPFDPAQSDASEHHQSPPCSPTESE